MNSSRLIFRQLFESTSSTFTYIVGCSRSRKAAIIDPVLEKVERDSKLINQLNLDLHYGINTHIHADHITGTGLLSKIYPKMKSVLSDKADAKADVYLSHRSNLLLGDISLECRHTPGHTNGCASYVINDQRIIFTGDSLFIRGCGRTDFQQGDPSRLYDSVWNEILVLPNDYIIYPGHNYKGHTCSSIDEEKKFNPRLTKSKEEFIHIMNNLNLPYPKQIDRSLPANLNNGEI